MINKIIITTSLFLTLTACNSKSQQHEVCIDAKSTTDYGVAWQGLLADAKKSGELSTKDVVRIQGKSYENLGLLKNENWSEFCNYIDKLRKENNF